MGSLLRSVKERKKSRRLGEVEVMEREEYGELDVDSKVEMIRALVPLGLMHVQELLDDEVRALAGERYARKGVSQSGCCRPLPVAQTRERREPSIQERASVVAQAAATSLRPADAQGGARGFRANP